MFDILINSLARKETIFSIFYATVLFFIINYLDLSDINRAGALKPLYRLAIWIFLFVLIEVIIKKNIFYCLFLYLLIFPVVNWIVVTPVHIGVTISVFYFNINLLLVIILFIKTKEIYSINNKRQNFTIVAAFICIVLAGVSAIQAVFLYIAINSIIYGLIVPLLLYIISNKIVSTIKDKMLLFEIIVFSMAIHFLFTFMLEGTNFIYYGFGGDRYSGIFKNANTLAAVIIIVFFATTYLDSISQKLIYKLIFFISFFLLLLTGSRAGLILVILGVVLWISRYESSSNKFFKIFIFIIAIIFLFASINIIKLAEQYNLSTILRLSQVFVVGMGIRSTIWAQTWQYITSNNLYFAGVGLANHYYAGVSIATSAHNAFLELASTIGIFAAVLYHAIFFRHIRKKSFFKKNDSQLIVSIVAILFILFINIVGFEFVIYNRNISNINGTNTHIFLVILWLFLGGSKALNE